MEEIYWRLIEAKMNMQKCCMEGKNKLQKHKKLLKRIIKEI
jgi:hypothetical protein